MADYINFKMKTGEDLVGVKISETTTDVTIHHPIQILVHPSQGYFAKSWMMLSDENEVCVSKGDLLWITPANEKAINHYDDFLKEVSEHKAKEKARGRLSIEDFQSEVEELFTSLTEAEISTKH